MDGLYYRSHCVWSWRNGLCEVTRFWALQFGYWVSFRFIEDGKIMEKMKISGCFIRFRHELGGSIS